MGVERTSLGADTVRIVGCSFPMNTSSCAKRSGKEKLLSVVYEHTSIRTPISWKCIGNELDGGT